MCVYVPRAVPPPANVSTRLRYELHTQTQKHGQFKNDAQNSKLKKFKGLKNGHALWRLACDSVELRRLMAALRHCARATTQPREGYPRDA